MDLVGSQGVEDDELINAIHKLRLEVLANLRAERRASTGVRAFRSQL
jgi:hypothetical protein